MKIKLSKKKQVLKEAPEGMSSEEWARIESRPMRIGNLAQKIFRAKLAKDIKADPALRRSDPTDQRSAYYKENFPAAYRQARHSMDTDHELRARVGGREADEFDRSQGRLPAESEDDADAMTYGKMGGAMDPYHMLTRHALKAKRRPGRLSADMPGPEKALSRLEDAAKKDPDAVAMLDLVYKKRPDLKRRAPVMDRDELEFIDESKQKEKNFFRDGNFSQEYVNQVLAEELEKVINEELNPLEIKKSICDNKDMILGAIKAGKVNNMLWWAEALGVIPEEMEQARETLENLLGTDPDKILSTPGAKEGAVAAIELMCMLPLEESNLSKSERGGMSNIKRSLKRALGIDTVKKGIGATMAAVTKAAEKTAAARKTPKSGFSFYLKKAMQIDRLVRRLDGQGAHVLPALRGAQSTLQSLTTKVDFRRRDFKRDKIEDWAREGDQVYEKMKLIQKNLKRVLDDASGGSDEIDSDLFL